MKILITGGSSGLGASIVRALAIDPDNYVYFTYASSLETANGLSAAFPNVKAIYCDFKENASVDTLLMQMPGMGISVLINNAYTELSTTHFHKIAAGVFEASFAQNIVPVMRITQEAINIFRKSRFGKIINILSSATINKPPAGLSVYVANKAYLLSMSKSWASENIKFNITSNSISPSFMQTKLTAGTYERMTEQIQENHPLHSLLKTEEVAEVVVFFTKTSQQVNGTNFIINAGTDIS